MVNHIIRTNDMLPGPAPERESVRQWQQRWKAEVDRRAAVPLGVPSEDHPPVATPFDGIVAWYEQLAAEREPEREMGPRPSQHHWPTWVRLPDGRLARRWRMPLMRPTWDLVELLPGRLEAHVSDRAWQLVQDSHAAMRAEADQWRRVSFRCQMARYGFADALVERALSAALAGRNVQVSQKFREFGSVLLVDGVEWGRDQWSTAALAGLADYRLRLPIGAVPGREWESADA